MIRWRRGRGAAAGAAWRSLAAAPRHVETDPTQALGHAANETFEALLADKVLRPLNMANATFDTVEAIAADRVAVGTGSDGTPLNLTRTCAPQPPLPSTWGSAAGCLWASADDLASLMKLFLRSDAPAGGEQVVDGDTISEMLRPSILLADGSSAVGSPWEMKYRRRAELFAAVDRGRRHLCTTSRRFGETDRT